MTPIDRAAPQDPLSDHIGGKLTPQEERLLAQAALGDENLFDALTVHGIVEKKLREDEEFREVIGAEKLIVFPHRRRNRFIIGTAAAVAALCVFYLLKPSAPAIDISHANTPLRPPGPPTLLARDLNRAGTPVFRGDSSAGRPPKQVGEIVSVEDGGVTINLGSLDGIAKGQMLPVMRGDLITGQLAVTAVFRDRARAGVAQGRIRAKDRIRVPDSVHEAAVLQQMEGMVARGQEDRALQVARDAAVSRDSPSTALLLNDLGVFFLRRGDLGRAEQALNLAATNFTVRGRSSNNLAALSEARGHLQRAESLYREALQTVSDAEERRAIQANLARLEQVR